MLTVLFIACLIIWLPILFYQIERRGFVVLISWLFIAPVASNLVNTPGSNPFFVNPVVQEARSKMPVKNVAYIHYKTTINLQRILEPTRVLLGSFLIVFLLDASLGRKLLVPLDRAEIWMILFSIILISSSLIRSIIIAFSLHTACEGFITPFLGYFFARRLVTNEECLRKLTKVIGYMGCYLIIIGLVEYATYQKLTHRLEGPFRSTNLLSLVMTVVFFVALLDSVERGGLSQDKRTLHWSARQLILYLAPVIILLTWTRGEWLGFFLAVGTFLFLGHRLVGPTRKLLMIGLALLIIMVIMVGVQLLPKNRFVDERITDPGTGYGRLGTWQVALQAVSDHPIFGIGLNNLRSYLQEHRTKYMEGGKNDRTYDTVHNSLLSILVELGAVGLFMYLAIIVSAVRMGLNLYSKGRYPLDIWRGIVIIAIMVAYQVGSLFSLSLYQFEVGQIYVYIYIGGIAGLYSQHRAIPSLSILPRNPQHVRTDMLVSPR